MSASRPTPPLGALLVPAEKASGIGTADPAGPPRAGENAPEPRIACRPGQTLAQALYLSGHFAPPALCSGLATCGRCRVRMTDGRPDPVPADRRIFNPEEIAEGWRLSCRHQPAPGMRVELPAEARPFAVPLTESAPGPADSTLMKGENAFLAVDLGTTSLEWLLFTPLSQGIRILWQGKTVNPQMGAGSDLISRLSAAAREGQRLGALTREALRLLTEKSADVMRAHGLPGTPTLCLAANTAMTAITLDADTAGLARAPYSLPYAGGQWENPPGLPRTWIPPQLSPFVGGDIAAGYAALALDPDRPAPDYPFLLADLGTNGEFLLALAPDRALAASVALGPALEGIGLTHGTEARPGAIADFSLGPKGLEALRLPASGPDAPAAEAPNAFPSSSTGITGTGYLALLRLLRASGAMDNQGHFTPDNCGPLKRLLSPQKAGPADIPGDGDWLSLPLGLRLTARDVEEILKVKAAFSLGLRRLLDKAGLAFRDLARIRIAGALGKHVNKQALEHLGFFPPGAENRLEAVGNTSLAGAALLLRNPDVRPALIQWAATVATLDLAADPDFTQNFTAHMRFVW